MTEEQRKRLLELCDLIDAEFWVEGMAYGKNHIHALVNLVREVADCVQIAPMEPMEPINHYCDDCYHADKEITEWPCNRCSASHNMWLSAEELKEDDKCTQ